MMRTPWLRGYHSTNCARGVFRLGRAGVLYAGRGGKAIGRKRSGRQRRFQHIDGVTAETEDGCSVYGSGGSWRFKALVYDTGCSFPGLKQGYNSLMLVLSGIIERCSAEPVWFVRIDIVPSE